MLAAVLDQHLRRAHQILRRHWAPTRRSRCSCRPVSGHSIDRAPHSIGSAAGQTADALPAGQVRSAGLPSAERMLIFTALSPRAATAGACSLRDAHLAALGHVDVPDARVLATSPARSAPKRPRCPAAEAIATCWRGNCRDREGSARCPGRAQSRRRRPEGDFRAFGKRLARRIGLRDGPSDCTTTTLATAPPSNRARSQPPRPTSRASHACSNSLSLPQSKLPAGPAGPSMIARPQPIQPWARRQVALPCRFELNYPFI